MSCQRAPEVHLLVDGELDRAGSFEAEKHIDQCEECSFAYGNHVALRTTLKNKSLYYPASDKLRKRIQSSLRQEEKPKASFDFFGLRWITAVSALAAVILIGAVVWKVLPRVNGPASDELVAQEVVSNHVRSLLPGGSHLTDVLSTDQHTVKPWFDGKVDFAPPVQDFASQDFRLYGGRLEYLNNRTVATLIYQRRLHYINLYIWPSATSGTTEEVTSQRNGYNLVHWTGAGMNYWAISDLNKAELHDFARLVQQGQ